MHQMSFKSEKSQDDSHDIQSQDLEIQAHVGSTCDDKAEGLNTQTEI